MLALCAVTRSNPAFLVHFQTLCLRRAHKRFSFRNFSLGNGFLTGARDQFGSLPSAIYLFKCIAGVPEEAQVIPAINTNYTITIAARLEDTSTLVGQCAISHPVDNGTGQAAVLSQTPARSVTPFHLRKDSRRFDTFETGPIAPPEGSHAELDGDAAGVLERNLSYRKGDVEAPLPSPISRVFYLNLYGQEIFPSPNSAFLEALQQRDVLVYSCGSLWTSVVPCLALQGVAEAIANGGLKAKILLRESQVSAILS